MFSFGEFMISYQAPVLLLVDTSKNYRVSRGPIFSIAVSCAKRSQAIFWGGGEYLKLCWLTCMVFRSSFSEVILCKQLNFVSPG